MKDKPKKLEVMSFMESVDAFREDFGDEGPLRVPIYLFVFPAFCLFWLLYKVGVLREYE